jgi:hypothetical protein
MHCPSVKRHVYEKGLKHSPLTTSGMWLIPQQSFDQAMLSCPNDLNIHRKAYAKWAFRPAVGFSAEVKDLAVYDRDLLSFISKPLLTVNLCLLPASYAYSHYDRMRKCHNTANEHPPQVSYSARFAALSSCFSYSQQCQGLALIWFCSGMLTQS